MYEREVSSQGINVMNIPGTQSGCTYTKTYMAIWNKILVNAI